MLMCTGKPKLWLDSFTLPSPVNVKIAVVDGMALVQKTMKNKMGTYIVQ